MEAEEGTNPVSLRRLILEWATSQTAEIDESVPSFFSSDQILDALTNYMEDVDEYNENMSAALTADVVQASLERMLYDQREHGGIRPRLNLFDVACAHALRFSRPAMPQVLHWAWRGARRLWALELLPRCGV